jgi:hypothetical protein
MCLQLDVVKTFYFFLSFFLFFVWSSLFFLYFPAESALYEKELTGR